MQVTEMKVKLTLTEGQLGTSPANSDVRKDWIMSKNPEGIADDENEGFDPEKEDEKGLTVFPRLENGSPYIFDYMIRGFFKDAQGCLGRLPGHKIPAYKKIIDGAIFIKERKIEIKLPKGKDITIHTRPLRAETAQGPRVTLAASEEVPAGSTMQFTIQVLDPKYMEYVIVWLDYGQFKGLGQWRNSGKGKFTWECLDKKIKLKTKRVTYTKFKKK